MPVSIIENLLEENLPDRKLLPDDAVEMGKAFLFPRWSVKCENIGLIGQPCYLLERSF